MKEKPSGQFQQGEISEDSGHCGATPADPGGGIGVGGDGVESVEASSSDRGVEAATGGQVKRLELREQCVAMLAKHGPLSAKDVCTLLNEDGIKVKRSAVTNAMAAMKRSGELRYSRPTHGCRGGAYFIPDLTDRRFIGWGFAPGWGPSPKTDK